MKIFDGENVTCNEFIEMLQVTKQKYVESPQDGTVDVEALCNDCINMVLELRGQLEETEKYAAVFINLLEDFMMPNDLCFAIKAVEGGAEWCQTQECDATHPRLQDCILKYAELKVGELDVNCEQ